MKEGEKKIQLASTLAEVEERTTTATTTRADLCQNETDLFVETRRAQTSDRRHAQPVTQMGKSVLSEHMHAPTKTRHR